MQLSSWLVREECKIRVLLQRAKRWQAASQRAPLVRRGTIYAFACIRDRSDEFEQARSARKLHRHHKPVTVKIFRAGEATRRVAALIKFARVHAEILSVLRRRNALTLCALPRHEKTNNRFQLSEFVRGTLLLNVPCCGNVLQSYKRI